MVAFIFLIFLGDPGVPQVTAEFETNTCTLNITVVPLSIALMGVDHFVICINGRNQTITGSDTFLSYPVLSCADSHNISASIVTRCGLMGQFSPIVTVDPDPSCDESACNSTTDSPSSSPSGIGKFNSSFEKVATFETIKFLFQMLEL